VHFAAQIGRTFVGDAVPRGPAVAVGLARVEATGGAVVRGTGRDDPVAGAVGDGERAAVAVVVLTPRAAGDPGVEVEQASVVARTSAAGASRWVLIGR
jgi:hypothetical protein